MIYSCFDPQSGLYDYFENAQTLAINADLPVPSLPRATQLGVASIEAGRPLPSDARPVGRGWHARGQVVKCGNGTLGAFDLKAAFSGDGWKWIGAAAAAYAAWLVLLYGLSDRTIRRRK